MAIETKDSAMSARDVIANIVVAEISSVVNDSRVKVALTESGADAILSALRSAGWAVVPVEKSLEADNVGAWLMHDNHTFTRLRGPTVAGVVAEALMVHEQTKDGMLCPISVMSGKVELRRVGKSVHLYSKNGGWQKDLAEWLSAVIADPDISRLLKAAQEDSRE